MNAGRPDHDGRGDAHRIEQPHVAECLAKGVVHAVTGIGQHAVAWRAFIQQRAQLLQCDLGLRGEVHLFGHAGFGAALSIGSPVLGQIQLPGHGQASLVACKRDAHGHLAVVLLA